MQANHVAVWLDHSEAHVIAFDRESAQTPVIVRAAVAHEHQHHRANALGAGKALEHPEYYEKIIAAIRAIPEWLIVGPANAKLAFFKYVSRHHASLLPQVIGIETVDHPTDGQLLHYARKYFQRTDQLAGRSPLM